MLTGQHTHRHTANTLCSVRCRCALDCLSSCLPATAQLWTWGCCGLQSTGGSSTQIACVLSEAAGPESRRVMCRCKAGTTPQLQQPSPRLRALRMWTTGGGLVRGWGLTSAGRPRSCPQWTSLLARGAWSGHVSACLPCLRQMRGPCRRGALLAPVACPSRCGFLQEAHAVDICA